MLEQRLVELTEAVQHLSGLLSRLESPLPAANDTPKEEVAAAPEKPRGKSRKAAAETTEETSAVAGPKNPAPESADLPAAVTEPSVDAEAARKALMKHVQRVGAGPVKDLIAEYADELIKVPVDKLPELVARAEKLAKKS